MAKGNSNGSKGKGSSPAAKDQEEEFMEWAEKEKKRKPLNWFPNSPPSPTGR